MSQSFSPPFWVCIPTAMDESEPECTGIPIRIPIPSGSTARSTTRPANRAVSGLILPSFPTKKTKLENLVSKVTHEAPIAWLDERGKLSPLKRRPLSLARRFSRRRRRSNFRRRVGSQRGFAAEVCKRINPGVGGATIAKTHH